MHYWGWRNPQYSWRFLFCGCTAPGGRVKRAGYKEDAFWLHKFRATFATHCLHSGLDIKTVQYLLGHKDIESTMRYLAPVRNAELRGKVDAVWAAPTLVVDDSEMPEREQVRLQ